jgi:hypothetical protein
MAEMGYSVHNQNMNPCYAPEATYQGCIDSQGCGDKPTWFCMGQMMYLSPDTCGLDGWAECNKDPMLDECE